MQTILFFYTLLLHVNSSNVNNQLIKPLLYKIKLDPVQRNFIVI